MGELHLEIIVDRMLREFKVDANVGKPQVAYRETIREDGRAARRKFVRQTGGRGQYGHVVPARRAAASRAAGFEFEDEIKGGVDPAGVHPGRREGRPRGAGDRVSLAGYPVVDVKVALLDGSYHEVDSSEMAFKIAASMAFKEACQQGGARCCSSRSWRSRSSSPRSSWAT